MERTININHKIKFTSINIQELVFYVCKQEGLGVYIHKHK